MRVEKLIVLQSYQLISQLRSHKSPISCLVFTHDSEILASGGDLLLERPLQFISAHISIRQQSSCPHLVGQNGEVLPNYQ
jgi:hypothetical protein